MQAARFGSRSNYRAEQDDYKSKRPFILKGIADFSIGKKSLCLDPNGAAVSFMHVCCIDF